MQSDNFLKIFYVNSFFLNFPIADYEISGIYFDSSAKESLVFIESFSDNIDQSISIEKKYPRPVKQPRVGNLWKDRLTASKDFKWFYSLQGDKAKLEEEIFTGEKKVIKTAAMECGTKYEPDALNYILIPTW